MDKINVDSVTLDELIEGKYYTLYLLEAFGTKTTIYYNARAFYKTEDGCGFQTFADGYIVVPKDRIPMVVKSEDTHYVETLYDWKEAEK